MDNFDLKNFLVENKLTINSTILSERKQLGDLYHFTYSKYIEDIKQKGIKFTPDNSKLDKFKNKYYISTTRDKDPEFVLVRGYDIRITLDGDKISDKYVVYPLNAEMGWGVFDDLPPGMLAKDGFAEERIISPSASYLSPKYFKKIEKIIDL